MLNIHHTELLTQYPEIILTRIVFYHIFHVLTTDIISLIVQEYINRGALWNCGIFAYKLKYVLEKAHEMIDYTDYEDLLEKYSTLDKISFDYAVAEKEKKILGKLPCP